MTTTSKLALAPEAKRLRWLLLLAAGFFLFGIATPMITVSTFIIVENAFSVLSGVFELLKNGQILLFIIVTAFSLVLPVIKIWLLYNILSSRHPTSAKIQRYLHLMHEYGRWAMLDVMVVAVLITTVKLGVIASVEVHVGLFLFATAVLLISFITHRVVRLTRVPAPIET